MNQTKLQIRLTPRSSRDRITGREGDCLKISLSAPPVDGQANQSLLKFLSKTIKVKVSALSIVQGAASRNKVALVIGLTEGEVWERLKPWLPTAEK
jgi:uncharacterized protein (TIGR00251 family)